MVEKMGVPNGLQVSSNSDDVLRMSWQSLSLSLSLCVCWGGGVFSFHFLGEVFNIIYMLLWFLI